MTLYEPPKKKQKLNLNCIDDVRCELYWCYSCDGISFVNERQLCQECASYVLYSDFNLLIKFKENLQEINNYFNLQNDIKAIFANSVSNESANIEIQIISIIFEFCSPCEYFQSHYDKNIKQLFRNNSELLMECKLKSMNVSKSNVDIIFKDSCKIINNIPPRYKYEADQKPFRLALNLCSILYYKKYIGGNLMISSEKYGCIGATLQDILEYGINLEQGIIDNDKYFDIRLINYENHKDLQKISKNLYCLLNNQSAAEFVYCWSMRDGEFMYPDGNIPDIEKEREDECLKGCCDLDMRIEIFGNE